MCPMPVARKTCFYSRLSLTLGETFWPEKRTFCLFIDTWKGQRCSSCETVAKDWPTQAGTWKGERAGRERDIFLCEKPDKLGTRLSCPGLVAQGLRKQTDSGAGLSFEFTIQFPLAPKSTCRPLNTERTASRNIELGRQKNAHGPSRSSRRRINGLWPEMCHWTVKYNLIKVSLD